MEPAKIPDSRFKERKDLWGHASKIWLNAPQGMENDVGSIQIIQDAIELPDGEGRHGAIRLYFEPREEELAALNKGGVVELTIYATNTAPVALGVVNGA